jgi:hypothetical protein
VNTVVVTSQDEVADVLASFLELDLGSANYAPAFLQLKAHEESHHLSFTTAATEPCNSPFSVVDLKSALKCTHDTLFEPLVTGS